MRKYGDDVLEQKVVEKILKSLPKKYDHIVAAIEESKDLAVLTTDELFGSLFSHEDRMKRYEDAVENAFYNKLQLSKNKYGGSFSESSNRGGFNRGQGACFVCKRYGHIARDCRIKDKQAKFAQEKDDEIESLFLAYYTAKESVPDVWSVDSGCNNHMTGNINLFINLDKSVSKKITMSDGTIREAQGKGMVELDEYGKNCIDDVMFVPHLDSNLLSVGQFMMDGYSLVFENMACYVYKDGTKKELLIKVPMAKNKCFPLTLDLLGLPIIEQVDGVCESCVYGKHHWDAFPKGKARRALKPTELIHADLTASYNPQQNGVAKRKNRSLVEIAKSMLKAKGIPNSFWAEAIHTVAYIQNRSPTTALHHQTPFEACDETKGYKFYDPIAKKLLISCDVIFDEKNSWNWNDKKSLGSVLVDDILEADPVMTKGEMGEGQSSSTPNSGSRSFRSSLETPPALRKSR
ncbi:hypothetical protein SLEP1_g53265 [Rubroshorea leprosula]|uniref:CCHC-type domain-containing protein n=1 Tax=Rubroshorea leprosula TaxID=152421 RepID=A0AAV5M8W5_9ROSI|nr:hypothetical protein SLEP1_g53265 [Rubroshorea leprosula]